ncbi:MAG: DnaB-like helicase C-terminal domain-containing protein [Acidobacteriota bacterium]
MKRPDQAESKKRPWEVFDKEIFPYLTVERLFGDLRSLRRDGRFWQAYCPVHEDQQGAFSIDPKTLEWTCFLGCGGGGPVQYLQSVKGLSWMDAAMELARLGGVDPGILEPWGRLWTQEDYALHDQLERRSSLLGVFMAYARSIYHSPASQTLRSELVRRYGFSERTVGELDLGLYTVPEDMWQYLKKTGRELDEVREWGLFEAQWTGCILGSWKDLSGRIINIWGWQPRAAPGEATRFEGYVLFPEDDTVGGKRVPLGLETAAQQEERKLLLVEDPLAALLTRSLGLERPFPIASGGDFNLSQMEAIQEYLSLGGELTLCWNHDPYAQGTQLDRTALSLELLKEASFPVYVMDPKLMGDHNDSKKRVTVTDFILANGGGRKGLKAFQGLLEEREVQVSVHETPSAAPSQDWPGVFDIFRGVPPSGLAAGGQKSTDAVSGVPQILQMFLRAADEIGRRVAQGFLSGLPTELAQNLTQGRQDGLELPTTRVAGELQASNDDVSNPAFSVDRLEAETRTTPMGKYSGWAALDGLELGFNPGELAVLLGKSGHGRTSMLLGILLEWLNHAGDESDEEVFLLYSMDERDVRIYHRLLSLVTADSGEGWTIQEVENYLREQSSLPFDHEGPSEVSLQQARQGFRDLEEKFQIIYQPHWTIAEVEGHARQSAESAQVGGILVDHSECLSRTEAMPEGGNFKGVRIGHRLKALAVELSCPIVATAQAGSGAGSKETSLSQESSLESEALQEALREHRPHLRDLYDEELGQMADLILGLFNHEAECRSVGLKPERTSDATTLEVGILKNRYGAVGSWAQLDFQGKFGLISDPVPD